MKKYLKYQPAWIQLILFGALTVVFFLMAIVIVTPLIANAYGLGPKDLSAFDFSNPTVVAAIKMLQSVLSVIFFMVPALLFAYLSDARPLHYIGFRMPVPATFLLMGIVVILASFPMVAWLGELNRSLHLPKSWTAVEDAMRKAENSSDELLRHLLEMKSVSDLMTMLVVMAVIPAVVEELFFRGVLQRLFIQMSRSPWTGIIFTSVIFSAIHGQFLGFIPRVVLGAVLGALFWYSGSLWPGIIAHFINNALQIIMVYYNPKFADKDPNFSAWLIAGSTLLVIVLTLRMRRMSQTSYAEVYDTDDDFPIGPRDQYIA